MLEPAKMAAASVGEIQDTLSEAGAKLPPRVAALLRRVAGWFASTFREPGIGDREGDVATSVLREQLLAVNGIAAGTADAVMLALGRPCCPIGPGIYRILVRHGWCDITADYDEASETLSRLAGGDVAELDHLVRGLTEVGRRYCGVRAPKCDRCPLLPLLPEAGPIDPHG